MRFSASSTQTVIAGSSVTEVAAADVIGQIKGCRLALFKLLNQAGLKVTCAGCS